MSKSSALVTGEQSKSKPFARLLVADDFRIENTGKLLAIGLYADGVVIFRVPENAPQPSMEQPFGMDSLSLLVVVGGMAGEAAVRITLANNNPIEMIVPIKLGGSANLLVPIKPFTFGTFGVKELLVEFAGTKHRLQFEIRAEYIEPVADLSKFLSIVTRTSPRRPLPPHAEDDAIVSTPKSPKRPKRTPKHS